MLYSEIIAVCSQIHTKHINTLCGQNVECRTYRAVNTLRLSYKNQPVNAVQWNNRCLFWDPHKTHKYTVWVKMATFLVLGQEADKLCSTQPLTEKRAL